MARQTQATVKPSPFGGDGLFALNDLKAGDLIFALERPLVAALDTNRLEHACSNCFVMAPHPQGDLHDPSKGDTHIKACTGCRVLRYCSKQCQVGSWKRHHKDECKLFRQYSERGPVSNQMRVVLQMLSLSPDTEPSPFRSMKSNLDAIAKQGGERYARLQILSAGVQQLFHPKKSVALMQQYFAMIQTNSFTLSTPTFDPIGVALDPFAAKANHSCAPNSFCVFDGAQMSFRALKPIAKHEEIFFSYVDVTLPFSRRQQELEDRFFFTCQCVKCQQGPTLREDMFAKDLKDLDSTWRANIQITPAMRHYLVEDMDDDADHTDDRTFPAALAIVQGFAFRQLDSANKSTGPSPNPEPTAVLKSLKEGFTACQQTGIWPEHRQPIPALRQEVFVNLLDGQSWSYALMQGLKLYFDIDPILYPEPFHPSRIIHKWTLAKLALMLADPQTPKADELRDVDFGVVIFGLLTEVQDNIRHSHGEGSRFARAVRGKLEEVVVDMTRGDETQLQDIRDRIEREWRILRHLANTPDADYWMSRV